MSHALLSASGASRWLNCPPSARLEAGFPDTTSEAAAEGTLAHAICELKLEKYLTPMSRTAYSRRLNKLKKDLLYQPEMERYTEEYFEYIKSIMFSFPSTPYVALELKLDYSSYAPGGFGTADCVILYDNTLWVIDFKYGKGVPVSSEENPQMMLYALGALRNYEFLYHIENVKMAIFQPRIDNNSVWELPIENLKTWGETIVKPKAKLAHKGEGAFLSGEHCRFCRAKAQCRERSGVNTALEDFKKALPPLLSNEEVGEILVKAKDLAKWAKDLEAYALKACLQGEEIPGWKAVEGRSNRTFTDVDAAFKKLKEDGYKEELLYIKKPITLTETETLMGKAEFSDKLSDFVTKPPGKPTLAKISDTREPITLKNSAQDDFKNSEIKGEHS